MQANIDRLIDPQNPGHLVSHMVFTGAELQEAGRRGILGSRGQNFAVVKPIPDPMSAKALRLEAPEELRTALAQAEANYQEAEKLFDKAWAARDRAIAKARDFSDRTFGTELTDAGLNRRAELKAAMDEAEQQLRHAIDLRDEARGPVRQAEAELENWVRLERLKRKEAAQTEEIRVKETPKVVSLADRLAALKSKFIG